MATIINIEDIITDAGTQARERMDAGVVTTYVEAMKDGAVFPPVLVFEDDGEVLYLADGFHRLAAAKRLKKSTIAAEVRQGSRRDAMLYALGANAEHGLQRTRWDKRRAVELALGDEALSQESNREIARICRVDEKTVRNVKKEFVERQAWLQERAEKARADWEAAHPDYTGYWELALLDHDELRAKIEDDPALDLNILMDAVDATPMYHWEKTRAVDQAIRERAEDDLSDLKDWEVRKAKYRLGNWAVENLPFVPAQLLPVMARVEPVYWKRAEVIAALEEEIEKRKAAKETPEALAKAAAQKQAMKLKNGAKGLHNIETDERGIAAFSMYLYQAADSGEIVKAVEKLMEVTGGNQRYRILVQRA